MQLKNDLFPICVQDKESQKTSNFFNQKVKDPVGEGIKCRGYRYESSVGMVVSFKILVPSPQSLIPLTWNCFSYFFKILGLDINI